jgi:hypothetical protein
VLGFQLHPEELVLSIDTRIDQQKRGSSIVRMLEHRIKVEWLLLCVCLVKNIVDESFYLLNHQVRSEDSQDAAFEDVSIHFELQSFLLLVSFFGSPYSEFIVFWEPVDDILDDEFIFLNVVSPFQESVLFLIAVVTQWRSLRLS